MSVTPQPLPESRRTAFTKFDTSCVKGLAILLMLTHHCFLGPDRYQGKEVSFYPFAESSLNAVALSFKICVALFVFISGFGITCSYLKLGPKGRGNPSDVARSMAKRLVSLLGGYLFIFMLAQLWSLFVIGDDRWGKIYGHGLLGLLYFGIDAFGLAELFGTPTFLATFWYMSLAILIVVLVPILLDGAHRYGYPVLFFLAVLFRVLFIPSSEATYAYLPNYLACLIIGMWSADRGLIARYNELQVFPNRTVSSVLKAAGTVLIALACLYLRQKTRNTALLSVWDAVIPLLICCTMQMWVNHIPLLNTLLAFIGKHSMNIFLIHNFIRVVWYYDFTYSFKAWWLIILVLLSISLVLSIAIEALKKLSRYNDLISYLRERCNDIRELDSVTS